MTYAQALRRRVEHLRVPPELEAELARLYGDTLSAFEEELLGTAYDRALEAAEEGRSELYITGLLAALLTDFRANRATRRDALQGGFNDVLKGGYEKGAADQLKAFGENPEFNLTSAGVITTIATQALDMASFASLTNDRTLYQQAAKSALVGDEGPQLDNAYLADLNARTVLARGMNAGALGLVLYSVAGRAKKTWRHGPNGPGEDRRPAHAALEGVTVGLTEFFSLDGVQVAHPHDWIRAGADQWAACHCMCVYTLGDNATVTAWRGG